MQHDPQMRWFRLWTDILVDPKIRLLAFEDRWHYVAILCMKRSGQLDVGAHLLERMVGVTLGLGDRDTTEVKRRLSEVGLIDANWQPCGWDKRQYPSDIDRTAAERQRRHRLTKSNELVTRDSRVSNARVTTPETEQRQNRDRTEQRKKRPPIPASGEPPPADLDLQAWERFRAYRIEIRKPIKPASLLAAQRALAGFGCDQLAVVEQSIAQGWQGLFPLKTGPVSRSSSTAERSTWRPDS